MICTTQKRKGSASPSPASPFLTFQLSAAFLLHPSHSDISINRTLLVSFLPAPLSPQKIDRSTFRCSALQPNFVFHCTFQYVLSFTQYLHFLRRISTPSFHLHHTFQLRVPSGPAGNAYLFFSLLKYFEDLLAVLVHCLLGNLRNGNTCFFRYFQLCNSVTPTFTSSLSSRYFSILLSVFPKAIRRLCRSSTATHWLSSSLDKGEICSGNGVFRVLSRHGGAFSPLPLDTQYHATRFANSLAVQRSFPDSACHEVVPSL